MLSARLEKMICKELAHKEALIDKITAEMQALAELHYSDMLKKLESIPGLGKKTAMMLVVITGGFKKFDDYRKLSSYFGLCPRIFESGTSVRGKQKYARWVCPGSEPCYTSVHGALSVIINHVKNYMNGY